MDINYIAAAIVSLLAPYLPRLVQAGKATVEAATEAAVREGSKVAWQTAQRVWQKIHGRFSDDTELVSAAQLAAAKPEQEEYKTLFAKVLAARLQEDTTLAQEMMTLLGGQEAVQEIVAQQGSWVESVWQDMEGSGEQSVKATDGSVISGVGQSKR